jgi:hypothetical protein
MTKRRPFFIAGLAAPATLFAAIAWSQVQASAAQPDSPSAPSYSDADLQLIYLASIQPDTPTTMDEAMASVGTLENAETDENGGCADGYFFWMRDSVTPLCQPLCGSDSDCGPDDGRCRILDIADKSIAPPMLLVDDMTPTAVEAIVGDPDRSPPATMVCDPFWDVDGPTAP